MFISLKVCVGFSIFDSVSFLLKFIFLFNKKHELFDFNRKATHGFAPRPVTFKLQQELQEFSYICVTWSSPKTNLKTNFLNLKNRSLECVTFSQ